MPVTTRVNENTDPQRTSHVELGESESLIAQASPMENEQAVAYAKEQAFLHEEVEVMILPSQDQNDETKLVDISVNGKTFYFLRGEWRKVPRYVLEVLATAKGQMWTFAYKMSHNGATVQTQDSAFILRYPHQYRDSNPEGAKWYDSIRNRAF